MIEPEKFTPDFRITATGNPALPGIVFLHGFLGSGIDWLPIAELLEARYHCILVDLPGHGGTRVPEGAEPDSFFSATVEALALKLKKSFPGPLFLAGYSMGGRIALALLLSHPELFRKCIIVSASPGIAGEIDRADRIRSDEGIARKIELNFEGFIDAWYEQPLFATLKTHPLFSEVQKKRKQSTPRELAEALRLLGTGRQPSLWEKLKDNGVPVRFFVGEKDVKFVEIGRQMVNLCPDSAMENFRGCGHTLHIENRALFAERLKEFFNIHHNS
ncbi:MAG: 2-succinyl-6-hydroxy-2,4-cyclohexadiene-1-carboxylate synthase [Chlorobiaceae bacterium]|nr:2-succinyl-6-hydroxy-2,4-cyclohexadiene-1-carboxylate synthase [Chlorobiaceae bacterium]